MASPIVPKSEIRQIRNISVGYGEVPAVEVGNKIGWGLPGKGITFCAEEAKAVARILDAMIRRGLKRSSRDTLLA